MNNLKKLVDNVVLSVTALSIVQGSNLKDGAVHKVVDNDSNDGNHIFSDDGKPKLVFKNVTGDDGFVLASHRSHRSHSSHQSHRSHYSSSGGGRSSISNKEALKNVENNNELTPIVKGVSASSLGGRVLKLGMKGKDVEELKNILIKKGYKTIESNNEFDKKLELAIIDFQVKSGVEADGVVGPMTVFYLKYGK